MRKIVLDNGVVDETLKKARKSPRKRAVHCFHKPTDTLQRMVNAGLHDTYVPPHKHENPDKLEIMMILRGKVAVIFYNNDGAIKESFILDESGPRKAVEIPPKTWHNFVVLSKEAALYEIIEGRYDPKTHKKSAPWAPKEGDKGVVQEYLKALESIVRR